MPGTALGEGSVSHTGVSQWPVLLYTQRSGRAGQLGPALTSERTRPFNNRDRMSSRLDRTPSETEEGGGRGGIVPSPWL